MNKNYPVCCVQIKILRTTYTQPLTAAQRIISPALGLLVGEGQGRCIISAGAKTATSDHLSITAITGICDMRNGTRKKLETAPPSLCDNAMVFPQVRWKNWAFLAKKVFRGEKPGWIDGKGVFTPASPLTLPSDEPLERVSVLPDPTREIQLFGVRSDGTKTETHQIPGMIKNTSREGFFACCLQSEFMHTEFGGGPILTDDGELIGMGLFSKKIGSNQAVVIGMTIGAISECYKRALIGLMN